MSAAVYAARAELDTLMLDAKDPGGQILNTNEVQNYIGIGAVSGSALGYRMFEHTQQLNVPFARREVVRIEPGEPMHPHLGKGKGSTLRDQEHHPRGRHDPPRCCMWKTKRNFTATASAGA